MAFDYTAYGLVIRSDSEISFLVAAPDSAIPSVEVAFAPDAQVLAAWDQLDWKRSSHGRVAESGTIMEVCDDRLKITFQRDQTSALMFYISADVKHILVQRGGDIPQRDAISFLIGPILGAICRLRAKSCLHAAVLSHNGNALAICGDKGAGKSTTSAMLLKSGAELVADDIAVIEQSDGRFWVQPGYPHMRVSADVLALLDQAQDAAQSVLSIGDKKYLSARHISESDFAAEPVELRAVYVLSKRGPANTQTQITPLPPGDAIRHLNSNAYGTSLMKKSHRLKEFNLFADFAREQACRAIQRPDDLSRLEGLSHMILQDFEAING